MIDQCHFVSINVEDYAALQTQVRELEAVARAVVEGRMHQGECWRKHASGGPEHCICIVRRAQRALEARP